MAFLPNIPPELFEAYRKEDRAKTIRKTKWGCWLGIMLVPIFGFLDHYTYPEQATRFFHWRLLCSGLMVALFFVLYTPFGKKFYHFQGLVLLFLPSATISLMVYATEGAASPYYAGLTLVLMILAVVLDWPFWQSVVSVILVLSVYFAACWFSPARILTDDFAKLMTSNLFFLTSSGAAIIAGTIFHSRVRIQEFISRAELGETNQKLEASFQQLKENEMQLVQSEKLASLGRMSAGIIHEINNPLNFATTGLFTLRKKGKLLPPDQQTDFAEVLGDIEDGLKRVQTIVSDLRMFTHPNTEQLDPVPVGEIVTPALRLLSNQWKDLVKIEQKFPENQTILANKNKLIQVLVNLVQNSMDAMKTKSFTGEEKPTIWIEGRIEKGLSVLTVRDNGPGIDKKNLGKIFDPFFTTRDVGAGMGLGLSICYNIVQEYGGKIMVKTDLGKYCEFALEFPDKKRHN